MRSKSALEAASLAVLLLWALSAGFYYAFSVCVIPGLVAAGEPAVAARAMQAINAAVRNYAFFVSFFGPIPFTALLAFACWWRREHRAALLFAFTAALYVFGILLPTMLVNVPMNEALAAQSPAAVDWAAWSAGWEFSNRVRLAAAALGVVLCGGGLLVLRRAGAREGAAA